MDSGVAPPEASRSVILLAARVGGVRCAFVAEDVIAVHPAARPEPVPAAPSSVEGILNIAGRVVPVLDLRRRLRLPPDRVRAGQHLVELQGHRGHIAVRVDRAESLEATPGDSLCDVPLEARESMARGAVRLSDGLLVIYDPSRFLDTAEVDQIEAALEARSAGTNDA